MKNNQPQGSSSKRPQSPRRQSPKTSTNAPQSASDTPLFPMRINKYLAFKNHSTRRGADELIQNKRVTINGEIAVLGDKVNESDIVDVRHNKKQAAYTYYAFNKPVGVISHSPQLGEKDIMSTVHIADVFPVGRLDKGSHGLIILTNDGRVTDRLLNPKYIHEKEYVVTTLTKLRSNFKEKMEAGVDIGDHVTKPCKVEIINNNTFKITLSEGKKHQIRRMCSALFTEVSDLKRIRIMNIHLGTIARGTYRQIEGKPLEDFLKGLNL